jgi:hypothetical protein
MAVANPIFYSFLMADLAGMAANRRQLGFK